MPYLYTTRSQAVARIADRTASQHLWGIVTSSVTWPFDSPYAMSYWWSFGTKPLSLTVSEIFNVGCNAMVDMTLTSAPGLRPQTPIIGSRSRARHIFVPTKISLGPLGLKFWRRRWPYHWYGTLRSPTKRFQFPVVAARTWNSLSSETGRTQKWRHQAVSDHSFIHSFTLIQAARPINNRQKQWHKSTHKHKKHRKTDRRKTVQ